MDLIDLAKSETKAPVELTIDAKGIAESTYGRRQAQTQEVMDLIGLVADSFPAFLTAQNFQTWEMIGFTKADGLTYFEDTVSVVYRGVPSFAQPNIPISPEQMNRDLYSSFLRDYCAAETDAEFLDYYVIKYQLQSKTVVLKCYDSTFGLHALPNLPLGIRLLTQMGVGIHFGSPSHVNFRDIYFAHPRAGSIQQFADYHHLKYPTHEDDDAWRTDGSYLYGYGLTYDVKTLNLLKLKRYFFPHDPSLAKLFDK